MRQFSLARSRVRSGANPLYARLAVMGLFAASAVYVLGQQYPFLPIPGSPKGARSLFQDSRGRLWIGGNQLACFDGTRFFYLRDYGFPAVATLDIAEDPSGAIWIGAETGVYRISGGRVDEIAKGVAVSVIAGSSDTLVAAMGPAGRGLPASADLVRIRRAGTAWKTETIANLHSPGPLTIDPRGTVLFPQSTHGWGEIRFEDVVRWQPGMTLEIMARGQPGDPVNGRWQFLRDHAGCVWVTNPQASAYVCGGVSHPAPFEGGNILSMRESADGTMVLRGTSLLAVGRPGAFRIATRANGLPGLDDAILAQDGTIWLAGSDGLYRFPSPFRIESWTIREGLPDPPWSIARAGGEIFAGLDRRIVALSKDRLRWNSIATFKDGGLVSGLANGPDGTLLASFIQGGAVQLRTDGQVIARTEPEAPKPGSMRWGKTTDGKIWLGGRSLGRITRAGRVLRLEDHALRVKPSGNVLAIKYEDHTKRLWSCYSGGLILRDEVGNWKEFNTADGLKTNPCWSLAPLPNGDLWYAYFGLPGFALIHPNSDGRLAFREYAEGVVQPQNTTFESDHDGRLWRSGELGIFVANASQAEAGDWIQLGQSDGFPANGINTGSVLIDSDHSMWWGADNDLTHYTPPVDLVSPGVPPQVFVSAISWGDQPPRLADAVDSVPSGAKLVAHFGSLQFDRRSALRLRYRILPDQSSWRETKSGELDVPLGPLSSGAHTLEVQARVFTGPWSSVARQTFSVLRPIGLTWPFLSLYLVGIPSIAAAGFILRRRHKLAHATLLPDLARWRVGALLPEVYELAGTILDDRFEVRDLLARGGFAYVMDGYDREKHERCAIKVFRSEVSDVKDKAWIEYRFAQEVAALERVHHPNVVSIYAHGTAPSGVPYLVMEFIEGSSLRTILEQGALTPKRAATFLRQLASALDSIHGHGICHRDVKPENIIIRKAGSADEAAILVDFSIAIVKDANKTLHGVSRAAGTFDYMAPEQAVGHAQASSDIYSLAKVAIEMMTGRRLTELLPSAALDLTEKLPELLRSLPVPLSETSMAMLAVALTFDPARRPNQAGPFAAPLIADLESDRLWHR